MEFADLPLWAAAQQDEAELPALLRELFPEAGPELQRLYQHIHANAGLTPTDFYTIRDLLELSGYEDQEPLHALLLAMLLALDEGSLRVEVSENALAARLTIPDEEADTPSDEARAWARRICQALDGSGYPELIGAAADDGKPVVLRRDGGRAFLYFQKYLRHEQLLRAELDRRLRLAAETTAPAGLAGVLKEVLVEKPRCRAGRPMELSRDQRLALGISLLRNFAIVSGGPGTGKTSIVFTLLRCLARLGHDPKRIALAAPTGRAAQRLTDSLRAGLAELPQAEVADAVLAELTAQTLHRLLGYHPVRGTFRHHTENPLPFDVVVVDEVSMVGLVLMARLFQALAPETKLVLLGDKDQLPSVEAGAVLANLVPTASQPGYSDGICNRLKELWSDLALPAAQPAQRFPDALVVLRENYRSQRHIQEVADAVNRQQADVIERLPRYAPLEKPARTWTELEPKAGCWLLHQGSQDLDPWRRVLAHWAEHHYLAAPTHGDSFSDLVRRSRLKDLGEVTTEEKIELDRLFALLDAARVLTLVREGPWGCVGINRFLEQLLRPRLDRAGRAGLFAGAPVLITRNDHDRGLFNGDVGLALKSDEGYRVVFPRLGGYVALPADLLPAHELAFALTVHKSQGSEYGRVLLVLPPEGGRRLLTKEMIYTGITRARRLAVVCATEPVLRLAIRRRVERDSGL